MDESALVQLKENIERARVSSIFLYGANDIAREIIEWSQSESVVAEGVFDRKACEVNNTFYGVPLISPDSLLAYLPKAIAITSLAYKSEIRKFLESISTESGVSFLVIDSDLNIVKFREYQTALQERKAGKFAQSNDSLLPLFTKFPDHSALWQLAAENYHSLGELSLAEECKRCCAWLE